jgi:predicted P-loop ATPase
MKVTVYKRKGNKETVVREELLKVVEAIATGEHISEIHRLRQYYHLMSPRWTEDGRMKTNLDFKMTLPRLCFAAEIDKYRKEHRVLKYNGLMVLEANNLLDYDEAIRIRNDAARLPQTMLAFLGASGRSVKIVCRGELLPDNGGGLPTSEEDIEKFHKALYATARKAYNAQLEITIDAIKPLIHRTVYMSVDPELRYREQAVPFYIDLHEKEPTAPATIDNDLEHYLMPGRTVKRTYILNYQFVLSEVMGRYFDLPDENRTAELLMQIAAKCLEQGIPQQIAINMTMCHPVFNTDKLLVEKTFENVYMVQDMEEYQKRNRLKPLKSVPEDTLLMMKTDIFLHTHYEMRKNVMTGVAQYRENNGEDDDFRDLDDEARNEMTMRAKEMGLKTWDKDIARFIESPRIDKYDPVNTWLDSLRPWDGKDRIKALAARVPTNQPHWEEYLHTWLLGMVAHWQGKQSLSGNALVPLLIGRQGCGKSSFCRILLPQELRDYYNDRINFKNETDLNLGLTSFALINIDEFDKTTARQQVLLKYLLSTADVKFRPPYGKAYKQYRRYASFIGTTNQPKPLTDPTGSRRFVCVEVTDLIDFEDNLDHEQIFAQLKAEINQDKRYWLNDEEIARLIEENERFQHIDSLEEMIASTFRKPEEGETGYWLSATEVLEKLQKRYGKTSTAKFTPEKVGSRLNSRRFNFETDHKRKENCYLLVVR